MLTRAVHVLPWSQSQGSCCCRVLVVQAGPADLQVQLLLLRLVLLLLRGVR